MKTKKKKRNFMILMLDIVVVLIVAYFIVGYLNFFKISKDQKPLTLGKTVTYQKNGGEVTVNDYTVYKIIKFEIPNQNISYSMKLWFMDDIK